MDPRLRIMTSIVCDKISKQPEYSKLLGIKDISVMNSQKDCNKGNSKLLNRRK